MSGEGTNAQFATQLEKLNMIILASIAGHWQTNNAQLKNALHRLQRIFMTN